LVNPEQTKKGEGDTRGFTGIQTSPKEGGVKTENNLPQRS